MVMIKANIYEVKTHLSDYLAMVAAGESVIICKRNIPIAELHAIQLRSSSPRPIGLAKGLFEVTPAFFEALPKDILAAFNGEGE